ncbi:thiol reductase thioredoxin [Candidatus Sumerlaeota bacterium]|nr:thiol reductase thioredoxin [Candidatus Sumerlaeota bacterium]
MDTKVMTITDSNFDEAVLRANLPVLIDFWAPTCEPCRRGMPILDELAREYWGIVTIGKVNCIESSDLAQRYGVAAIPTFVAIKQGEMKDRVVGALSRARLVEMIEELAQKSEPGA